MYLMHRPRQKLQTLSEAKVLRHSPFLKQIGTHFVHEHGDEVCPDLVIAAQKMASVNKNIRQLLELVSIPLVMKEI